MRNYPDIEFSGGNATKALVKCNWFIFIPNVPHLKNVVTAIKIKKPLVKKSRDMKKMGNALWTLE